jgi:AcrR family transcriptional regulator
MGRDPDPTIKVTLLQKALGYFLENGVQNLSLRPLAKDLGTNARMLIYHFGSKEQLIIETLELAQQHQLETLNKSPKPKANSETELARLWQWFSSENFLAFGRLLFEVEILGINGNAHYRIFAKQVFEEWVKFIQTRFSNCDDATARVIVNTFSGLLLDLLVTRDFKRINGSFRVFSTLLIEGRKL